VGAVSVRGVKERTKSGSEGGKECLLRRSDGVYRLRLRLRSVEFRVGESKVDGFAICSVHVVQVGWRLRGPKCMRSQ
jgi:hypothetical protein